MEKATNGLERLASAIGGFGKALLAMGENRLELWLVEVQEERDLLLRTVLLGLGVATLSLLALITLTAAVCVLCWERCPGTALLSLTAVYSLGAAFFFWRLTRLRQSAKQPSATLDQLRKDRAAWEKHLP
jgi:uncharacterized membrane protein YqjE